MTLSQSQHFESITQQRLLYCEYLRPICWHWIGESLTPWWCWISAASDRADHAKLLRWLEISCIIRSTVLNWLRSYLQDRTELSILSQHARDPLHCISACHSSVSDPFCSCCIMADLHHPGSNKIQNTGILVLAHLGCPGKWLLNKCVNVLNYRFNSTLWIYKYWWRATTL